MTLKRMAKPFFALQKGGIFCKEASKIMTLERTNSDWIGACLI